MKKIIIIGLLFSSLLEASPTENEFILCQKKSVKLLERCLDMGSDYKNTSCWKQSKNSYNLCYKEVMLSHNRKAMAERKAAALKAIEEMKSHDYYKKKTIQESQDSKQALKKKFDSIIKQLKENLPMGDKDHDKYLIESLEQNQKDWLAYQYSTCRSTSLIEVYPSTSRLYTQTMNSCLAELNKKRIKYLDNLIAELKSTTIYIEK